MPFLGGGGGGSAAAPSRVIAGDASTLLRWKLDEATGNYVSTGTNSAVDMIPSVTLPPVRDLTAIFGACPFFTSGANIVTADTAVEPSSTAFSVSVWVNLHAYPVVGRNPALIEKMFNAAATERSFSLQLDDNNNAGGLYFNVNTSGVLPAVRNVIGTGNAMAHKIQLNTWTLVSMTYDGANVRLYVGGNLVQTTAQAGAINWGTHGKYRAGGVPGSPAVNDLTARIKDIRIESAVRSRDYWRTMARNGIAFFDT